MKTAYKWLIFGLTEHHLENGDLPFTANPAESFTIPARFYLDESIYKAELQSIFYCSWWYSGHVSQLSHAGDYITTNIDAQNIFIVRDKSGELKAFYNVCQHRGHELVEGTGNAALIVCPYHAWTYALDGSLHAARNSKNVPGFNKCEFALKPVRVEVFCGMVFINLDADATPLAEQASELEKEIREYCPTVDTLALVQRDTYNVKSNHKDFVDLVDMKSYRSTVKGIYSSHISKAAVSTDNAAYKFKVGDVDFGYAGWFLWPNVTLWAYPGDANLSVLQMIPDGVGNTLEYQDWFVPNGNASKQLQDAMDYQKEVLQPEDIGLCESVQRGLSSKGYNQGRFIVDSDRTELSEHAVHHFQHMVISALGSSIDI